LKAVVYYGPGDIRVEDLLTPKIRREEILIKVKASGLCPTDVRIAKYGSPKVKAPVILGHEFSGVVEEAMEIEDLRKGDRVTLPADIYCGKCNMCRRGLENHCENALSFGYNLNGSHAEYILIPREAVIRNLIYRIPPSMSFEEAVFTEPLACCINSIEALGVTPGTSIAIIGDGPMGLLHVQLARIYGADEIVLIGLHDWKLDLGAKLGASTLVNAKKKDPIKEVLNLTAGKGVDKVVLTAGLPESLTQALKFISKKGIINIFAGVRNSLVNLDTNAIHYNEIFLTGTKDYTYRMYEKALRMIAERRVKVKELISHKYRIDEIEKAITTWENKEKSLKIILYD